MRCSVASEQGDDDQEEAPAKTEEANEVTSVSESARDRPQTDARETREEPAGQMELQMWRVTKVHQ